MYRVVLIIFFLIYIPSKGSLGINVYHESQIDFKSQQSISVDLIIDGLNQLFDGSSYDLSSRNVKSVNYLKSEMQRVGRSLLNNLQYFLSYFGLFRSNNKLVSSVHKLIHNEIRSATFKDEVLRQYLSLAYLIPLHCEITTKLNRHYRRSNYRSKGYAPSRFNSLKEMSYNNNDSYGFKWLNLIEKLIDFFTSSLNCLDSAQWYNLKEAFAELTKRSLDGFKRLVGYRLKKSVPNHPQIDGVVFSESQAFTCHILVKNLKTDFSNCLQQVREIDICSIKANTSAPSDRSLAKVSKTLRKSMKSNSGCDCIIKKINATLVTFCKDGSKSNLTEAFILLFSPSNHNKLSDSPNLRYVMNFISKVVVRNDLILNAFKELVGMKKMLEPRYSARKLRENLSQVILRTISRVHVINTRFGRELIGVSKEAKRGLSKNLRTMQCLDRLIDLLLNHSLHRPISDSRYLRSVDSEHGKGNPLKYHEKSIRELVVSIRSLSELNLRKSSTIFTLANTFLLATVFYECISILVTLMYRGDNSHFLNGNPTDHNHSHDIIDGHHGNHHITTEQINIIDDNYGEYEQFEQPANRIHRRETEEQLDDFLSMQNVLYDNTENFDYNNFYDDFIKRFTYKRTIY